MLRSTLLRDSYAKGARPVLYYLLPSVASAMASASKRTLYQSIVRQLDAVFLSYARH